MTTTPDGTPVVMGNGEDTRSFAGKLRESIAHLRELARQLEDENGADLSNAQALYDALLAVGDAAHFATQACLVWRKEGAPTR